MEKDELLIDDARNFTCLYNSKLQDFKSQLKKKNALASISKKLERTGNCLASYNCNW